MLTARTVTPTIPRMAIRETLIERPRHIIDRRGVQKQLNDLAGRPGCEPGARGRVLSVLKSANRDAWREVKRRFEAGEITGPQATRQNAYFMDQLIRCIYDFAGVHVHPGLGPAGREALTICATGGYGRGELAPFSDVDLMFLSPRKPTPRMERIVEFVLYMLWDTGLKVGHATRSIEEVIELAKEDITIRTSMLEARWIWGDQELFGDFRQTYWKSVVEGTERKYVELKLAERDARHEKIGGTRYVLEPNIKEGKGGLRDLQTLIWIAKTIYRVGDMAELGEKDALTSRDVRLFRKAEQFLWTVRCHLHYVCGRPEERLTFDVQREIAERLNYKDHAGARGVERFMKHYFLTAKGVGDLTGILCAVLEEGQKKSRRLFSWLKLGPGEPDIPGFTLDGGRLMFQNGVDFQKTPVRLLELFHAAQVHDLDIHPRALRLVTQNLKCVNAALRKNGEANRLFIGMLTGANPVRTLMRLNEAGVFGRFVPDFGRVVAQMQYDMYHVYTVDEHTIRAIGVLNGIETGQLAEDHPVACSVVGKVQSRRALYVAVLLHDIAKGRGGDHSILGAKAALRLCPRFGLNEWETETVAWLVKQHLLMSATAFKRDMDDPKTIDDFCAKVQSPERLRLLLALTVADIRAVGPDVWNNWKAGLLRDLYWQAEARLTGEIPQEKRQARVARAQDALRSRLTDWAPGEIDAHIERGRDAYWLTLDTETHTRHARLIRAAGGGGTPRIEFRAVPEREATEVLVHASDHPGLFAGVAGALALAGVNILDAKIATLTDGAAIDTFWVQGADGVMVSDDDKLKQLRVRVIECLTGGKRIARELARARKEARPSRARALKAPPRVLIDNKASNQYTVIEINGRDRIGFLYDMTSALTGQGLQIASAQISTYGERVVDVFYVKDVFGLKILNESKLKTIEDSLVKMLEEPARPKPRRGTPAKSAGAPRKTAGAAAGAAE